MPNTIEQNLTRLIDAKTDIADAITAKGGTVNSGDGLEEFATDIMSIKNDLTSIDITENGTYYSGDETVVTSSTFPVVVSDSNGTPVRHTDINGNTVQNGAPSTDNPIIPEGCGDLETVGTKAGQFKIPISSAGQTTPIYLGEVETTRKIKKLVLTGEENFILKDRPDATNYMYVLRVYHNNTIGVCSHLPYTDSYPRTFPGYRTDVSMQLIYICIGPELQEAQPGGNTVEGFRYYLAAQYANGTPVTVWYVLAEPETAVVNEPLMKIGDYADTLSVDVELPLSQNTKNNIDVNTTLKPSSAAFTYNKLSEYIGYNEINVDVSNSYTQADEGKVVSNGELVAQTAMSAEITSNDTYDTTLYNSVTVNVPQGGGTSVSKKDVNFYDYDGTVVASYTASEFAELSGMPNNPTHDGLTAQGWNWSLADAKIYVASYGKLNIGQMYITSDGKTRLYISLSEGRISPILQLYLNANSELDIDWGDNSTHSTFTTTSAGYKSERHSYSTSGDYVIAITVVNGGFVLQSSSTSISSILWNGNSNVTSPDSAYSNAIKKIEIGNDVISIGDYAFDICHSLISITIPTSVTSIGNYAFNACSSLISITIPNSIASIGNYAFASCYSLATITIPTSVTSISDYAFSYGYSLSSITIPDSVTSIGAYAFYYCPSLSSIVIPDGVTSIGSAFSNCYSLSSITIPTSVTSIGNYAFNSCYSLATITINKASGSISGSPWGATMGSPTYTQIVWTG